MDKDRKGQMVLKEHGMVPAMFRVAMEWNMVLLHQQDRIIQDLNWNRTIDKIRSVLM